MLKILLKILMMSSKIKYAEEKKDNAVINRYSRQELISGWDQKKIENSSVALIGSGNLAYFTSASLVALGFGNVEIYGDEKIKENEFLFNLVDKRYSKVETLEEILSKINPLVNVIGVHAGMGDNDLIFLMEKPKVIIDVTNNPRSKDIIINYSRRENIPVISASTDIYQGELHIIKPRDKRLKKWLLDEYDGLKQGNIPSAVLAGIITEEARKIVMKINKDDIPIKNFYYSSISRTRFSKEDTNNNEEISLEDKYALVVGAGALGNFVTLGLTLNNIGKLDILDFDDVEPHNLNRQLLFYDNVGEKKSLSLASKIKKINPEVKVNGIVDKLDEKFEKYFRKNKPDIILDCVDNLSTRAIANYFAIKYKIPLISGGTDPYAGQVVVYKPGESACLDCKLKVDKALAKERTSHSCTYAAQPSVITTNQIIGGLMVGEVMAVLDPENHREFVKKTIKYDSRNPSRAGLVGSGNICNCKRGTIKKWLNDVMKKAE